MENAMFYKGILLLLLILTAWSFFQNLVYYLFGIYDIEVHNNRLKQLDVSKDRKIGQAKKDENTEKIRELIDQITIPIIKHIMPNVSYKKDFTELERNIKFAEIDKYITPIQFTALILLGKVIGFTALVLMFPYNKMLAAMWFVGPAVLPSVLFKNTIVNKREKILLGFPEFINISKSYLVSGMGFEMAVEESINYVNPEWQKLLKSYLINSETYSREECLTKLADECNSFEVKEFISMVKLNAEQGIKIKESFDKQYEKIKDLQLLAINKKIEGRRVWAILVQAPVLLTILVAFGLPMAESMLNFTGNL